MSVVGKFVALFAFEMHNTGQVKIRLIWQLIRNISRVLQKIVKYHNGTAISVFTVPLLSVLIKNLDLSLSGIESVMLWFISTILI